jgi:hypothetical protein
MAIIKDNMDSVTQSQTKPTRDELKRRIRARRQQHTLGRMNAKTRNEKLDKMKLRTEMLQKEFMESIKNLTPEQLRDMGINLPNTTEQHTVSEEGKLSGDGGDDDDEISIPKMTPV